MDAKVGMHKLGTVGVQYKLDPKLQSRMDAIPLFLVVLLDKLDFFLKGRQHELTWSLYTCG